MRRSDGRSSPRSKIAAAEEPNPRSHGLRRERSTATITLVQLNNHNLSLHINSRKTPTTTMSTAATVDDQFIEHIVLFKLKPNTPETSATAMLNSLSSLSALPQVHHLSATAIHHPHFNLLLHIRFKSITDLETYLPHPSHIAVVNGNKPIVEDMMAVDWWASGPPVEPVPNSNVRVTLFKVKEGSEEELERVLNELGVDNYGRNFEEERSKGFSIGSVSVSEGLEEKVGEVVEDVVVVEYVVPAAESDGV